MNYKKQIFIGSSTESLDVAKEIKVFLEELGFACRLWNGDFFEYGHSYIEDLVKKIIAYDYAIMIGGPDDEVIRSSTGLHKIAPRDNIYLEYGLFSGIISPYRTLMLKSKRCSIASDLEGITLADYDSVGEALVEVQKWIADREGRTLRSLGREHIELLPTVGIAVGYYENFLLRFKDAFKAQNKYENVRLSVFVPEYLTDDCREYIDTIISRYELNHELIEKMRLLTSKSNSNSLDLYDVPTTIVSLFKTVDYIWGVEGNTDIMSHAKLRALENFANNLQILINKSSWLKSHVIVNRFNEDS